MGGPRVDAIRDAEVRKHMVSGLDGRYMSGEGTEMVENWLRRSEQREEEAIRWSLEASNRLVREERRKAKEDQSEDMEVSESESSGCDEEVETWKRVGHRTGRKKAKVDRGARSSDSGWGQRSQSVSPYSSQSVNQAVSGEQREEVQMEVESGGDSGAAGSSGQGGIDGAESRGDMVEGESYAEEDDELMLEYMENEGVGSVEIDRFMGWTTVDVGDERFGGAKPPVEERVGRGRRKLGSERGDRRRRTGARRDAEAAGASRDAARNWETPTED